MIYVEKRYFLANDTQYKKNQEEIQNFRKKEKLVIHFNNFHMHKLDSDEIKQFMDVIRKAVNSLCNKS